MTNTIDKDANYHLDKVEDLLMAIRDRVHSTSDLERAQLHANAIEAEDELRDARVHIDQQAAEIAVLREQVAKAKTAYRVIEHDMARNQEQHRAEVERLRGQVAALTATDHPLHQFAAENPLTAREIGLLDYLAQVEAVRASCHTPIAASEGDA